MHPGCVSDPHQRIIPQRSELGVGRYVNRTVPWDVVGIVTCGVAGVTAGLWSVWLVRLTPISPRASLNFVSGMEFGIRGPDLLVLGIVVAGVLASLTAWRAKRTRVASIALTLAGTFAMSATIWRLVEMTGRDGKWASYFLGPGVYVTLGGGVLLVAAGAISHSTHVGVPASKQHEPDGETETSLSEFP